MNKNTDITDTSTVDILSVLKDEVRPALGCTEPAAVALAAAKAASLLKGKVCKLEILTSEYILKNGMFVGIPNVSQKGLDIAAALGAIIAKPEKGLMVLTALAEGEVELAQQLAESGNLSVTGVSSCEKIYIEAILSDGEHTATATIKHRHSHFSSVTLDGVVIEDDSLMQNYEDTSVMSADFTILEAYEAVCSAGENDLSFLDEAITMNTEIALEGLKNTYGLQVGKMMNDETRERRSFTEIANYAASLTAAAADARMAGCEKPVMSLAGSGNQGLVAFMPVIAAAEKMECNHLKTLRSLALSALVTIHAKHSIGRLSSLCGCAIAAAIGTCSGIIYLYGGDYDKVSLGIKTMVADIAGIVCDGAKAGCALKIATSVESAFRAANMALNGSGATQMDGIVEESAEDTLSNLGKLGNEGMATMNKLVLGLMQNKSKS